MQSNMVYFSLADSAPLSPQVLLERLKAEYGVLLAQLNYSRRLRAVTHYYISRADVEQAVDAFARLLTA